jgi:hypothetical protein
MLAELQWNLTDRNLSKTQRNDQKTPTLRQRREEWGTEKSAAGS